MRAIDEGLTRLGRSIARWFFSPIGTRLDKLCTHPDRGLERCGIRVQSVGEGVLTTCNTLGCPRMAKAQ
jgi:hypothetical protein